MNNSQVWKICLLSRKKRHVWKIMWFSTHFFQARLLLVSRRVNLHFTIPSWGYDSNMYPYPPWYPPLPWVFGPQAKYLYWSTNKKIPQVSTKKQSKTSSYQPPPKGGVFSPQNGVAKNGTPSTPIHFKARRFKGSKGNFPTFNFPTHQPSTSQASTFPNFQVRIWNL